jgi:hypothetical protein
MARDDGFAIADVDTGLFDDSKVRALWRQLGEPNAVSRAMTIYVATLLESWATGRRVPAADAVPVWLPPAVDDLASLTAAGLLDADGRLPSRAWASWFGPARDRREAKRTGGRRGGLKAHGIAPEGVLKPASKHSSGIPRAKPDPSSPSVPTDPSVAPARARNGGLSTKRTNGRDLGTCPSCGDELHPGDTGVRAEAGGQLWHETCPTAIAAASA